MKNQHISHIEELMFDTWDADRLYDVLTTLCRVATGKLCHNKQLTMKIDGSPSIFIGTDPCDGKFFVAKKSIFNKQPIVYKSYDEIYKDHNLMANQKLFDIIKTAFLCYEDANIFGVLQGDLLFIDTHQQCQPKLMQQQDYYYFTLNVIKYKIKKDAQ